MNALPGLSIGRQREAEREFFGLELDSSPFRGTVTLTDALVNPQGHFYGGAGVAIAVAMMEAATDRPALWTTLQFLATAFRGARLQCSADVRAHGHKTSQVRVTAFLDGAEVFSAVGATGDARADLDATFERMPRVRPPHACPVADLGLSGDLDRSRFATTVHRLAADPDDLRESGSQAAFWARVDNMPFTPAMLGYVADVAALGMYGALARTDIRASSLDNTLRVGPHADAEWVLLDLRAHCVAHGYGHGSVHLWAPDGTLLAMMNQTMALRSSHHENRGPSIDGSPDS